MISQEQASRAYAICERAQEIIALIQRDFAEMQKAAAEFNERMAKEYGSAK